MAEETEAPQENIESEATEAEPRRGITPEEAEAMLADEPLEESKGQPETEEEGNAPDDAEETEPESGEDDDPVITLPDGEEVPWKELQAERMRERDYRQKTNEHAQAVERFREGEKAIHEQARFLQNAHDELAEYVRALVTPEPDIALSYTDPARYTQQKAMHDRDIAGLTAIMQRAEQVKAGLAAHGAEDAKRYKAEQDADLAKAIPRLADPAKRAAFDADAKSYLKTKGFSDDEVADVADSRILQVLNDAIVGRKAIKNLNRLNNQRRHETPKQAKPQGGSPKGKPGGGPSKAARERFLRTRSLEDAAAMLQ